MKLRLPRVFRRLLSVVNWRAQDDDMDQEMAFHVDAITREYVRAGMSDADAARAARKRFGSTVRHKEAGHDARTGYLDQFAADVRSGIRQLVNARGFAIVAIVTLALGVGVNTAVFTVVKSVLLDALPYADADQLVRIHGGGAASTAGARTAECGHGRGDRSATAVIYGSRRIRRCRHRSCLWPRGWSSDHHDRVGRAEILRHARRVTAAGANVS